MELSNGTMVQEFVLLGFRVGQQGRLLLLILFTAMYTLSLAENFVIVTTVVQDTHLARLPMYILLSNFSFLEMCYVSATMPRMLFDLSFPGGTISFQACFFQIYIFFSLGETESIFLSAMALDRYLAICHPLRYPQIMTQDFCYRMVTVCWILGFSWYVTTVVLISQLSFCGSNIINHFMCDSGPILALACPPLGYTPIICQLLFSAAILIPFVCTVVSYAFVCFTLMKTSSKTSRTKGFSTVSSHLVVVTLFYGTVVSVYVGPSGESHAEVTKVVTLLYSAVTPVLNPLIYCLRNDHVKAALARLLRKKGLM